MSDVAGTPEAVRAAVVSALQQAAQGQAAAAVETLRPYADSGDPVATALVAYYLGQSGQAAAGLPYAERAVKGTVAPAVIAVNYGGWTYGDPTLRDRSVPFWKAALDGGWTIDPISQAQQLAQQGDGQRALELLEHAQTRTLTQAEQAWKDLVDDIDQSRQRFDTDLRAVTEARAKATDAMSADAAAIEGERKRIEELVAQTTSLLQNVAAENLAGEYAERARAANRRASTWTNATLGVSLVAIAVAAAFVLIGLANHHTVSNVLTKAAISLPLLALAAYLNKLGTDERRDARNWTHIELQIRTAQPYLGNLPEELREEVQAALALRFFPGQAQDPHGAPSADADPEEMLKLIRAIRTGTG